MDLRRFRPFQSFVPPPALCRPGSAPVLVPSSWPSHVPAPICPIELSDQAPRLSVWNRDAPVPVQDAEGIRIKQLTRAILCFFTEFSTAVLKSAYRAETAGRPRRRPDSRRACPERSRRTPALHLPHDFFQHLLINVEVGVDVLYVVVLFEGFHQANHRRGLLAFQLDVGIGNHAHARRNRLDAGLL